MMRLITGLLLKLKEKDQSQKAHQAHLSRVQKEGREKKRGEVRRRARRKRRTRKKKDARINPDQDPDLHLLLNPSNVLVTKKIRKNVHKAQSLQPNQRTSL